VERASLREEVDPPQGFCIHRWPRQHRPASFQVEAAQVTFRHESGVDVRLRVKPAIGRRRFLREDEELAATARTPKETGERIDDRFVNVRVAVQDEELSLAGEDLPDRGRDGLRPVRVRCPLAGRMSQGVREGFEIVAGFDLHPHRARDALGECPAERGLAHARRSVPERDGGRARQPSPQEGEVLLALQERRPFEVLHARLHPSMRVEGGQGGQHLEAEIPPRLSQRRRPAFDFHARRVDLAEDLPGAAHPGFRQGVDADLPIPPEEPRVARLEEPLALEAFQGPRDMAPQEPGAFRDPRLGSLAARFSSIPETVEVEEDSLRTIIRWVANIPTTVAQGRLDLQSEMDPLYNGAGVEIGVNVTLTHQGGEALQTAPTIIYITSQRGTNPAKTDVQRLHRYNKLLATPSGIIDGTDTIWNVG